MADSVVHLAGSLLIGFSFGCLVGANAREFWALRQQQQSCFFKLANAMGFLFLGVGWLLVSSF